MRIIGSAKADRGKSFVSDRHFRFIAFDTFDLNYRRWLDLYPKATSLWWAHVVFQGFLSFAQAQPVDFKCPEAGTVQVRPLGTIRATGPSTTDAYVCNLLDDWGKPQPVLFGLYPTRLPDIATIGPEMLELIPGRKTSVSFEFTTPAQSHVHHTWTLLQRETITVAGKARDTIVFDLESQKIGAAWPYYRHYRPWFDPMVGAWIKTQPVTIIGTAVNISNYEDISITAPE